MKMKNGFVKVAAATADIRVADVAYNMEKILEAMKETERQGAKVVVFPELCLTGYTCGDLFGQELLLKRTKEAVHILAEATEHMDGLFFVGAPLEIEHKLYNTAVVLNHGAILGIVTKTFLPNYGEFYDMRQFQPGPAEAKWILFDGERIPFGPQLLFQAVTMEELVVSAEICEDVWSAIPPSIGAARAGATVIVNCSASDETMGKSQMRRNLLAAHSMRLFAGYVYANAGEGESTTDLVFDGHNMILEHGELLCESEQFSNEIIYSEIDVQKLISERRKNTTFQPEEHDHICVPFYVEAEEITLTRHIQANPFIPEQKDACDEAMKELLMLQAMGLKKRLMHTNAKTAVVGISGGLDSTLALLVTAKAFDMAGLERKNIRAVTMPCFGTTDRTYTNACLMAEKLGTTLQEIPIKEAVKQHFQDIGHDETVHDVTYENSQARERTQILMDVANELGGLVIGTGDMSELALGWATYNGDHMSMYGVNAGVPKTQVRYIVQYYAEHCEDQQLKKVLLDVLETPVSPELLPPKEGEIAQKTEDLVGPYELHDFFLFYMMRYGFMPSKIYRLAVHAFAGVYEPEEIYRWLCKFYWRFFSQQFKRSCMPDGPKVNEVGLSPRGDLKMPSDACAALWVEDLKRITVA